MSHFYSVWFKEFANLDRTKISFGIKKFSFLIRKIVFILLGASNDFLISLVSESTMANSLFSAYAFRLVNIRTLRNYSFYHCFFLFDAMKLLARTGANQAL